MTEAINRNLGAPGPYGYKQLPGVGPAGGADMKGVVCAGIGVALGIVVGTLIASGAGRAANPGAPVASVAISPNISASARPAVSTPANPPAVTPVHPAVTASANPPAVASANPPVTASVNPAAATGQTTPLQHAAASSRSPHLFVAQKFTAAKASAIRNVSIAHKRRSIHMLAARRRHRGRRTHSRHRLHTSLRASTIAKLTPKVPEPELEPDHAHEAFAFTVEGDATEANYNPSAGLIETYEGVTFALDRTASGAGVIALQDYPANIHYRCNQFGNCTLVRAGAVVLSAMRIKEVALIR